MYANEHNRVKKYTTQAFEETQRSTIGRWGGRDESRSSGIPNNVHERSWQHQRWLRVHAHEAKQQTRRESA